MGNEDSKPKASEDDARPSGEPRSYEPPDVFDDPTEDREEMIKAILKLDTKVVKLCRSEAGRKLTLYRLSLTVPDPFVVYSWLYGITREYARRAVTEDGEGIWIMADWREDGTLHFYGLALSAKDHDWFISTWVRMTGASPAAVKVNHVKEQKNRDALAFEMNVARVILYASKDVPNIRIGRAERCIAFGVFATAWKQATGYEPMDADFDPPWPQPPHDAIWRLCQMPGCGKLIPPWKPPHTKFCADKCRKRFNKSQSRPEARNAASDDNDDAGGNDTVPDVDEMQDGIEYDDIAPKKRKMKVDDDDDDDSDSELE